MKEFLMKMVPVAPKEHFPFQCRQCGKCCRHVKESVPLESLDAFRLARYLRDRGEPIQCMDDVLAKYTESIKNVMTDTFNRILLEEVEDFIQTHMRVWKCDRLTVEMQVIKVEAELFPLRAYESDIAPVSEGDAQNEEGSI